MPQIVRRTVTAPLQHRLFKPRLQRSQVIAMQIIHEHLLGDLLAGPCDSQTLWDWLAAILTWCRVAELQRVGEPEMAAVLELGTRLVERYGATSQVQLLPAEHEIARWATAVMHEVAAVAENEVAVAATHWSEACLSVLQASAGATTH
jgi:hypothetical protein